jgi:hypothetical protein
MYNFVYTKKFYSKFIMYTFNQKIIFILFIVLTQFLPDFLKFYKTTWLADYINFFWFDRVMGYFIFFLSLYISYISVVPVWPIMKNNFPFNLFFSK